MGLNEQTLLTLIKEVRLEFQIPPYFRDEGLKNYAHEGEMYLLRLNPGRDINKDKTYRMSLKNYVNYAYHHKVNEWKQNYATLILEWQLGSEVQ